MIPADEIDSLTSTPRSNRRRSMHNGSTPLRFTKATPPANNHLHSPMPDYQTPGSGVSSTSITNVKSRRSLRRAHPKTNVPLARIVTAATSTGTVGRTPEEISASYEQWMKLAADNKINASNSWHLGLIDYFADMGILKHGDGGINFQKASCTLDGCVKIYSTRVDAVALETEQLVSGLNDTKQSSTLNTSNLDHDGDTGISDIIEKPKRMRRANTKTLEKDFDAINVTSVEAEFMIDPLFRKTCAEFDEGGAHSLLLSRLAVGGQGEIIFDSSDVVSYNSEHLNTVDDSNTIFSLSLFPSIAKLSSIDLSKKTISNSMKKIVISDDIQGIETLTEVLELELLDAIYNPSQAETDNFGNVPAMVPMDVDNTHSFMMDQTCTGDAIAFETDLPEYVAVSLNPPSSSGDFYSEANIFDDEFENETAMPDHRGASEGSVPNGVDVDDDQFLMVPLPRSKGIFASLVQGPASKRIANLRSSTVAAVNPDHLAGFKRTRKPLETIQFKTALAPKIEDLFAKGTGSINIPRQAGTVSTDITTMRDMHIATNPFDPATLARSCLRSSTTFPKSLARELKGIGAVPRMIELLGGIHLDVPVVVGGEDEEDGMGAEGEWDVEVPVMDEGEEDDDVRLIGMGRSNLTDPVVVDDMAWFGGQDGDTDMMQPATDFAIDSSTLGMGGLALYESNQGFNSLIIHGGHHPQLSYNNGLSQFRRNRMGLNFAKRTKRVDVKRLKENIWKAIRRKVVLKKLSTQQRSEPEVQEEEEEEVDGGVGIMDTVPSVDSHGAKGMAFSDMIQMVGQEYTVDHSKEISIPFYFICILHLANEKNLELDARGMKDLYVKSSAA